MADLLFIAVSVAFFVLAGSYALGCDHLLEDRQQ